MYLKSPRKVLQKKMRNAFLINKDVENTKDAEDATAAQTAKEERKNECREALRELKKSLGLS